MSHFLLIADTNSESQFFFLNLKRPHTFETKSIFILQLAMVVVSRTETHIQAKGTRWSYTRVDYIGQARETGDTQARRDSHLRYAIALASR